tara:strand:- start:32 stop:436 length:405 start_codon:yes stop_codon:yes gene_type:complete
MSYYKPKRNRFRSNNKGFRRNGSKNLRIGGINADSNNFQRKLFDRNGYNNAEKLLEKYNNLAKEASASGDRILSESYYQYADHFLRVIENRNLVQNNSKLDLGDSSTKEKSDDKIILKDKKDPSPLQTQNTEEI